jgi:hypothetical protein
LYKKPETTEGNYHREVVTEYHYSLIVENLNSIIFLKKEAAIMQYFFGEVIVEEGSGMFHQRMVKYYFLNRQYYFFHIKVAMTYKAIIIFQIK